VQYKAYKVTCKQQQISHIVASFLYLRWKTKVMLSHVSVCLSVHKTVYIPCSNWVASLCPPKTLRPQYGSVSHTQIFNSKNWNNDQSNLAKGGIAPCFFARWQQQFTNACFGWGFWSLNPSPCLSSSALEVIFNVTHSINPRFTYLLITYLLIQGSHLTQYVIGAHKCTCQMASKSVERFKHGERMWQTTDRQTTLRRDVWE